MTDQPSPVRLSLRIPLLSFGHRSSPFERDGDILTSSAGGLKMWFIERTRAIHEAFTELQQHPETALSLAYSTNLRKTA
jgi:hypothetical protein